MRCGFLIIKQTVNFDVEAAFSRAKSALLGNGCKVLREQAPITLVLGQGSLMGIAPKKAKKTIYVDFEAVEEKTLVSYRSAVARDWIYITLIGCSLSLALATVCLWISWDLEAFMATGHPSVWSWLITAQNQVDFQVGRTFVNLAY